MRALLCMLVLLLGSVSAAVGSEPTLATLMSPTAGQFYGVCHHIPSSERRPDDYTEGERDMVIMCVSYVSGFLAGVKYINRQVGNESVYCIRHPSQFTRDIIKYILDYPVVDTDPLDEVMMKTLVANQCM